MARFVVAIDGPAGAGKGTIARALAQRFGLAHLDTGALYRAVAMKGGDPVAAALGLTPLDLACDDLRTPEAARGASRVAVIPEVRAALLDFQHRFAARKGGAVLDGRDIGTVICPDAPVKFFVTASAEVRARRRWLESGGEAGPLSYEKMLAEVKARDELDISRAEAPLRQARDAILLDTSMLSEAEAIAMAGALVALRLEVSGGEAPELPPDLPRRPG